jgi:hypothetical protein
VAVADDDAVRPALGLDRVDLWSKSCDTADPATPGATTRHVRSLVLGGA